MNVFLHKSQQHLQVFLSDCEFLEVPYDNGHGLQMKTHMRLLECVGKDNKCNNDLFVLIMFPWKTSKMQVIIKQNFGRGT